MKINKRCCATLEMTRSELGILKTAHRILKDLCGEMQRRHIDQIECGCDEDRIVDFDDVKTAVDYITYIYNVCCIEDPEVVKNEQE